MATESLGTTTTDIESIPLTFNEGYIQTRGESFAAGTALLKGALLEYNSDTALFQQWDSGSISGVLAIDLAASDSARTAPVVRAGSINAAAVIVPAGKTMAEAALSASFNQLFIKNADENEVETS